METEKIKRRIIGLELLRLRVNSIAYVVILLIVIDCILHIRAHGLKDLIDLIWFGPNK